MNNIFENFRSVNEFHRAVNTRKTNDVFARINKNSSHDGDESFTGTKNYQEANDLLKRGDTASLKLLQKANVKRLKDNADFESKYKAGVVGAIPIVPAYIAGQPLNMMQKIRKQCGPAIINVVLTACFSGYTDKEEIVEYGAKALSMVKALEKKDIRVNLYIFFASEAGGQKCGALIKLKDAAAPLNALRVAYPIVNPSFLRRHLFRWLETMPNKIDRGFTYSYGSLLDVSDERVLIKKDFNKTEIPTYYFDRYANKSFENMETARL